MKTNTYFWSYLAQFFLEWEMSEQSFRENRSTYFVFGYFFFENLVFYEIMLKIIVEPGRPYDGMAQALCMLDTQV